jgi:tripartite-type tricarboxylate transporter receptor subunit TctC
MVSKRLLVGMGVIAMMVGARDGAAQAYPSKFVRIVTAAPGSAND